jgi:alkanesulfonate monooxygenase SsuD/methylene tetrahydromethanopterin reductase-like flavin-dependent oxidoreductase (luciferase family)
MVDRVNALHDSVRAAEGGDYPVWVGGHAPQVREIVPLADGWNRWGGTADRFAREVELVHEVAPAATITWGGLVLTGADDAVAETKAETRPVAEDTLIGGPARIAEQLDAFVERGAEWVVLGPVDPRNPDNAAALGEVRRLLNA